MWSAIARFFGFGSSRSSAPAAAASAARVTAAPDPVEVPDFDPMSLAEYPALERVLDAHREPFEDIIGECVDATLTHFREQPDDIPALPTMTTQILSLLEQEDVHVNELVRLINKDPTIASQVLKAANSGLYMAAENVDNIRGAIVRLGIKHVGNIAAAASLGGLFDVGTKGSKTLSRAGQDLWRRSMICAHASAAVALNRRVGSPDRVFLGGMLHDLGKAVALRALAASCLERVESSDNPGFVLGEVLERCHEEISRTVVQLWSLQPEIAAFCTDHHHPSAEQMDVHVVRLTSALEEIRSNPAHLGSVHNEVAESLEVLGIQGYEGRVLATDLRDAVERVAMISQ